MNLRETIANNTAVSKAATKLYKVGPTVAFCVGAVGSIASLYLMWHAAKKHDEVMCDVQDLIDEVHEKKPVEGISEEEAEEVLTINEYRKELVKTYIQAGIKIGKLYAPVAAVEVGSIALMSIGYGKLNSRYVSTLAACTLMERQYAKYRQNVIDILGEDADREFRFGLKNKEYMVPDLDKDGKQKLDKNGSPKTKKIIRSAIETELDNYSMYARIFDKEHSKEFDGDEHEFATSWYNRDYIIKAQDYFNMLLRYRPNHTVFLNEVYDRLGFERTKEGQVVGWHYDPDYPTGDNRIEFVPIEFYDEKYQAQSVILDFNVDGNVMDLL